jgi:hypothetical protein
MNRDRAMISEPVQVLEQIPPDGQVLVTSTGHVRYRGSTLLLLQCPDPYCNEQQLREHFNQVTSNQVVRVQVRPQKRSALIQFQSQQAAAMALRQGAAVGGGTTKLRLRYYIPPTARSVLQRWQAFYQQGNNQHLLDGGVQEGTETTSNTVPSVGEPLVKPQLPATRGTVEDAEAYPSSAKALRFSDTARTSRTSLNRYPEVDTTTFAMNAGPPTAVNVPGSVYPPAANAWSEPGDHLQQPDQEAFTAVAGPLLSTEAMAATDNRPSMGTGLVGTCLMMCPLEEQQQRQAQRDVHIFEMRADAGGTLQPDARLMVKKFARPAAGAEAIRPEQVRPPNVLRQTLEYLLQAIVDREDVPFHEIYAFLRDRTRSIRQDFTYQGIYDAHCVWVHEQCVRFHIMAEYRLADAEPAVFSSKQNMEQLDKCLLALRHMYHDARLHRRPYSGTQSEFEAYYLLLQNRTDPVVTALRDLDPLTLQHDAVQFALQVVLAFQGGDFRAFFGPLLARATYLQACMMHRHFGKMRLEALKQLTRACSRQEVWPVADLVSLLAFDDPADAIRFLENSGIVILSDGSGIALGAQEATITALAAEVADGRSTFPSRQFASRSQRCIERKAMGLKPSEIIQGKSTNGSLEQRMRERIAAEMAKRRADTGSKPLEQPVPMRSDGKSSAATGAVETLDASKASLDPDVVSTWVNRDGSAQARAGDAPRLPFDIVAPSTAFLAGSTPAKRDDSIKETDVAPHGSRPSETHQAFSNIIPFSRSSIVPAPTEAIQGSLGDYHQGGAQSRPDVFIEGYSPRSPSLIAGREQEPERSGVFAASHGATSLSSPSLRTLTDGQGAMRPVPPTSAATSQHLEPALFQPESGVPPFGNSGVPVGFMSDAVRSTSAPDDLPKLVECQPRSDQFAAVVTGHDLDTNRTERARIPTSAITAVWAQRSLNAADPTTMPSCQEEATTPISTPVHLPDHGSDTSRASSSTSVEMVAPPRKLVVQDPLNSGSQQERSTTMLVSPPGDAEQSDSTAQYRESLALRAAEHDRLVDDALEHLDSAWMQVRHTPSHAIESLVAVGLALERLITQQRVYEPTLAGGFRAQVQELITRLEQALQVVSDLEQSATQLVQVARPDSKGVFKARRLERQILQYRQQLQEAYQASQLLTRQTMQIEARRQLHERLINQLVFQPTQVTIRARAPETSILPAGTVTQRSAMTPPGTAYGAVLDKNQHHEPEHGSDECWARVGVWWPPQDEWCRRFAQSLWHGTSIRDENECLLKLDMGTLHLTTTLENVDGMLLLMPAQSTQLDALPVELVGVIANQARGKGIPVLVLLLTAEELSSDHEQGVCSIYKSQSPSFGCFLVSLYQTNALVPIWSWFLRRRPRRRSALLDLPETPNLPLSIILLQLSDEQENRCSIETSSLSANMDSSRAWSITVAQWEAWAHQIRTLAASLPSPRAAQYTRIAEITETCIKRLIQVTRNEPAGVLPTGRLPVWIAEQLQELGALTLLVPSILWPEKAKDPGPSLTNDLHNPASVRESNAHHRECSSAEVASASPYRWQQLQHKLRDELQSFRALKEELSRQLHLPEISCKSSITQTPFGV